MPVGHCILTFVVYPLDNQTRQIAEGQLVNVMNGDFPNFVTGMLQVLVNVQYPERTRQMAGTLFKRAISSLSGSNLSEKQELWKKMHESVRGDIKLAVLLFWLYLLVVNSMFGRFFICYTKCCCICYFCHRSYRNPMPHVG